MEFTNINDFINWVQKQRRFEEKTSLDKMRFLSKLFNHPEKKFLSIHVTGTNGKGSTVAYLRSIYEASGAKVASFTSPYVICFNERIYYDGHFISDDDLLKYANLILSKYPEINASGFSYPTFFEFITILAFLYFADQQDLDIAIIEVGLGGRLDATNIITPICSIITNVAYDHMAQLGNTLELIAREKLGIVKDEIPLVTGSKVKELYPIMDEVCEKHNTRCYKVDLERLSVKKSDLEQSIFSYRDLENVVINLIGNYQIENACLAIDVVRICNNFAMKNKSNLYISNELLIEGLKNTRWAGRFECVSKDPLIFIDGGHNIDCIERVCDFVDTLSVGYKRAVISISADKEIDKMLQKIDQTFDEVIFTKYSYARSADCEILYNASCNKNKKIICQLDDCINYVFMNKVDFTIFIGSLYLVSEIRPKFGKN